MCIIQVHTLNGKKWLFKTTIDNVINQLYMQQYSRKLSLCISFYEESYKKLVGKPSAVFVISISVAKDETCSPAWSMTARPRDTPTQWHQNCVTAIPAKKEVCVYLPVDSVIMLITYSINGLSKQHEANEGPLKGRHSCCVITQKCVMWQCAVCDCICQTDKLCWQRGAAVTNPSSLEGINRQK